LAATTLVLRDAGRGPPQAGADVVGHDLDHAALVAVLGLPGTLLEPAGHDDSRALADRLAHVLGHLAPADDVEEAGLLLPFLGVAVLPAATDSDTEVRLCRAAGRVAHLGVAGDVANDRDVAVGHGRPLLLFRRLLGVGGCSCGFAVHRLGDAKHL